MEQYLNDSYVVPEPFTLYTIYDFDCHIMRWSNDKIRMPFKLNIAGNKAYGKLFDSRKIPPGVDLFGTGPSSKNIKTESSSQSTQISFQRSNNFDQSIKIKYDSILD